MEEALLPEEIIILILTFLPVKSLIRFICVSNRFRFIILSDPKFAKSQMKAAASETHRLLLLCTIKENNHQQRSLCRLESLDLDAPAFGDEASVRKLTLPFEPPAVVEKSLTFEVSLLGSSNGIVFLAFYGKIIYMWNPSIGFFKRLPDMGLPPHYNQLAFYGVGYLSATDDYRVFIYSVNIEEQCKYRGGGPTTFVFSTRANAWKKHQVGTGTSYFLSRLGITLNEALHWVDQHGRIVAFDLGDEEGKLREMSPPNFDNEDRGVGYVIYLGVYAGGCLSLARFPIEFNLDSLGCINVWVMNEYNVHGSWTKLFNLKFSDPPKCIMLPYSVLLIGTSMVAELHTERWLIRTNHKDEGWLIRTDHEDEGKHGKYKFEGFDLNMIQIQETLIWIHD